MNTYLEAYSFMSDLRNLPSVVEEDFVTPIWKGSTNFSMV